jgi:hypothetical protein
MIISGYHPFPGSEWFHDLWCRTLNQSIESSPVIFSSGKVFCGNGTWIHAEGDLGGAGHLLRREKHHFMPGVAAMWMLGLWYAYISECDAIYVEQDVLVFGHWVEQLYKEIGKQSAIFGTSKIHGTCTSLFLIRHHFIPQFIYSYLGEGPEDHFHRIPERKVGRMSDRDPEEYCRYSFGVDTDRPINYKAPVWFAQKFTPQELREMEAEGLISCANMPDVKLFSNRP